MVSLQAMLAPDNSNVEAVEKVQKPQIIDPKKL